MESREAIVSILKEYFLDRGAEILLPKEVPYDRETKEFFDLFVRDARNIVGIKVFTAKGAISPRVKRDLERIAVELLKISTKPDKAYVAVSERLRILEVPRELFETSGIGILRVKAGRVEELIPARPLPKPELESRIAGEIEERIAELRSRLEIELEKLSRSVSRIEEEVEDLRARLEALEGEIERMRRVPVGAPPPPEPEERVEVPAEGLPEFVSDNPWIGVLSKRGRESA